MAEIGLKKRPIYLTAASCDTVTLIIGKFTRKNIAQFTNLKAILLSEL